MEETKEYREVEMQRRREASTPARRRGRGPGGDRRETEERHWDDEDAGEEGGGDGEDSALLSGDRQEGGRSATGGRARGSGGGGTGGGDKDRDIEAQRRFATVSYLEQAAGCVAAALFPSTTVALCGGLLFLDAMCCFQVVCVMDGQCFDSTHNPAVLPIMKRAVVPVILCVLVVLVPLALHASETMVVVITTASTMGQLDDRVRQGWRFLYGFLAILVTVLVLLILLVAHIGSEYSDDEIRSEVTHRWGTKYGDRVQFFYTKNFALSDERGIDRLVSQTSDFVSHVQTFSIAAAALVGVMSMSLMFFTCGSFCTLQR